MTRYYAPSTINLVLHGLADPISSQMMKDAIKQMDIQDQGREGEQGPGATATSSNASSMSSSPSPIKRSKVIKSSMPAIMNIKPDLSYMNAFRPIISGPDGDSRRYRYRLADPTSRRDFEYYRDHAHRGYLSPMVKEGESPSLYFKVPSSPLHNRAKASGVKASGTKKTMKRVEKLW